MLRLFSSFHRCVLLAVLLGAAPAFAQSASPGGATRPDAALSTTPSPIASRDRDGQLIIRATRLNEPIVLDGTLDEEVYRLTAPVSEFVQQDPSPGAPATERTEAWFFFDERALYVSARCWDTHPEYEVVNDSRRDGNNFTNNENIGVGLDTYHDRRNGVVFGVTRDGGLNDGMATNERDYNRDWNTVWNARTSRFDGGWTVEIAIPFRSLRYNAGGDQTWGINVRRTIRWKNEFVFLTPIPPSFGLAGMTKFSSAATLVGLTLPPASPIFELKPYVTSGTKTDRAIAPPVSNELEKAFGFDTKYGVTRSLTADFTYNTDFAQVEDDEQQVNLTRFSLFFPEKREFFLENQGIFNFGGYGGRRGTVPGDLPLLFFSRRIGLSDGRIVPIRAGGRMTGKAGRYNIGLVDIQTKDDAFSNSPATNFAVVRLTRDILRRSTVGAFWTRRSESTVTPGGTNNAYAVDGAFSFFSNTNVNTYLAKTTTSDRTGQDMSYRGQLDYNGDRYGLQLERLAVQKNFNPEIGYARRQDFTRQYALMRFSPRPTSIKAVKKFAWEGSFDHYVNGDGRLETRVAQGTFRTEFRNSDIVQLQVLDDYEYLPRPFPIFGTVTIPVAAYRFRNVHAQYDIGAQRVASGSVAYDRGGFYGGTKTTLAYSAGRIVLSSNLAVEPSLSYNWVDVPQGTFVAKVVTARTVYTFTPRMFAGALVQYNSTTHSLSNNVRLRWEYQPGSELFVVYNDARNTLSDGFPEISSRSFVVKLTHLLRR